MKRGFTHTYTMRKIKACLMVHVVWILKGTATSKIQIFPLAYSAVYPSRLFWCELQSFVHRDIKLLSNIMGLNGTRLVVIKALKKHF